MKCFNCSCDIEASKTICDNCLAKINTIKYEFLTYIGSPESLLGYQKSYKLVLLKCIIEEILNSGEAFVSDTIASVKKYYIGRIEKGLVPDYDVDRRIANIKTSSDYDVFAVMKSQPFSVINKKGFLFMKRDDNGKLFYCFHADIHESMSDDEWKKLLDIIEQKLILYYKQDGNSGVENNQDSKNKVPTETSNIGAIEETLTLNMSVLDVNGFSVRAKNVMMRSGIYTVGDLVRFIKTNDLLSLKNLGRKTGEEILAVLQKNPPKEKDVIANQAIEITEKPDQVQGLGLNVNSSNRNLKISFLRCAEISPKDIERLLVRGYSKIGQLENFTLQMSIQMFGKLKGELIYDKLKMFEKSLFEISNAVLERYKENREFSIYVDRANKKTLQEIADKYGLTRERIRQTETRFFTRLCPLVCALVEDYMSRTDLSYVSANDILEYFDGDDYDAVIMYTLKESGSYEYLDFAELFIKKMTPNQDTSKKLYELTKEFIGDGIYFFDKLSQLEELLNDSGLDFISADTYLNYLLGINAYFYGDFITIKKLPYAKLCTILVNKYFKDGIKLHSDKDMNMLRKYFIEEFGDNILPDNNRTLGTRLSDYLILCDRGCAKTIENTHFDPKVIDSIKEYIDNSEYKSLYYREIFAEFEGILAFTSDIVNYHALHGVLAYLYKDCYEFSKDRLTKKNDSGRSISFVDRVLTLINNAGKAVTRSEIKQKIGGVSDAILFNAVYSSNHLFFWDSFSINASENLKASDDDIMDLVRILENIFDEFNGYCSERLVFEYVKKEKPEFIEKNHIENTVNLFNILQHFFGSQYKFSRPHICRADIEIPLTTKDISLYLLEAENLISRKAFVNLAKRVMWSEVTADFIFSELEKYYIRISEDLYIISSEFDIDYDTQQSIRKKLESLFSSKDYLSMIGFSEFGDFPSVDFEWNSFLLVSVVKKYGLGFKLISPSIKDRRYNKEIIVSENTDWKSLDDIVLALLTENNIQTIDESNLYAFLVIRRLVAKVLPKELYDSAKLKYSNGYFTI